MIDINIHEELRAKYNPEGSDLRKLQYRLLEMLDFIDDICKKNDIKYWLSSGTCLGAVRHGGFIPWDDDLDIEMMREDYEKFEKVFKETEFFALQTYKNEPFYTQPFAKLRDKRTYYEEGNRGRISKLYRYNGIFLDIFILEKSPYWAAESCHVALGTIRHMSFHMRDNIFYRFVFKIIKMIVFSYVSIMKKKFTKSDGDVLRHTCGTGCHKNIRMRKDIFPLSAISFEGNTYPIPGNVNEYLHRMFGDYMSLPKNIHTHTNYFELKR